MNNKVIFSLKVVLSVFIYLAIPCCLYNYYRYHLVALGEYQMYLSDWEYWKEAISYPAGFMGCIGEYLTTFFGYLSAGPLVLGILFLLCGLLLTFLLRKVHSTHCFFSIPLFLAIWLVVLHFNMNVRVASTLMLAFTLALACIYVSILKNKFRWSVGLLFIFVAYWLGGVSSILLFSIYVVWELFSNTDKQRYWFIALSAFLVGVIPLLARMLLMNIHPMQLDYAYVGEVYMGDKGLILSRFYKIWATPAVSMLFLFLIYKKISFSKKTFFTYLMLPLQLVLLLVFSIDAKDSYKEYESDETFMQLDYYVKEKDWQSIINLSRTQDKAILSNLTFPYINLALAKTGNMSKTLLSYPGNNSEMMLLPFMQDYLTSKVLNEIFFNIGDIANAQHMAFEALVSTAGGGNAYLVKRLAECSIILGDYKLARKYLMRLSLTPFYKKWANELLPLLSEKSKIDVLPWVAEKRKLLPKDNHILDFNNIVFVCSSLINANPLNEAVFEYLSTSFLLQRDLQNFEKLYRICRPNIKAADVPIYHQQAFAAIMNARRIPVTQWGEDVPISQKVRQNFDQFTRRAIQEQEAGRKMDAPEFRREFGLTYWYYFLVQK